MQFTAINKATIVFVLTPPLAGSQQRRCGKLPGAARVL